MVEFCSNCDSLLTGKRCKHCGKKISDEQLERIKNPSGYLPSKHRIAPKKEKKVYRLSKPKEKSKPKKKRIFIRPKKD